MNRIIQCPACSTKFAINDSQLAAIENPKFHCSRCNTVFALETPEKEADKKSKLKARAQEEILEEDTDDEDTADDTSEEDLDNTFEDFDSEEDEDAEDEELTEEDLEDEELEDEEEQEDEDADDELIDDDSEDEDEEIEEDEQLEEELSLEEEVQQSPLDLIRSLHNKDEKTFSEKKVSDIHENELKSKSIKQNSNWSLGADAKGIQNSKILDDYDPSEEEPENEKSQLPLFSSKETSYNTIDDDSDPLQGITVSWESSNPNVAYEVDLSKRKEASFSKEETQNTDPKNELPSKTLNDLFDREKRSNKEQVNVSGSFSKPSEKPEESSKVPDSSTSTSEKFLTPAIIEKNEDSKTTEPDLGDVPLRELDNGDIPLSQLEPQYNQEFIDNEIANRSMKHTTVIKRDGLHSSGFALGVDDYKKLLEEIDEDSDSPEKKPNLNFRKSGSFSLSNISKSLMNITLPEVKLSALRSPGVLKSFLIAWSIPFCLMLCLALWAYNITSNSFTRNEHGAISTYAANVLGLRKTLPLKAPPQGVSFSPTSSFVASAKDTNSHWIIINGHTLNTTKESVPTLEIVSLFYDKNHNLVAKFNSIVPNQLKDLDYTSFDEKSIVMARDNIFTTGFPPNTSRSTTLAFPDDPNIRWFASRVYAAKF